MTSGLMAIEREFFRALNALSEPLVRAGIGSPALCPTGVILLETTGRRSGQPHRTPVFAVEANDHVLVATARSRSDWMKNLRAHPTVRYWLRGTPHEAEAYPFPTDESPDERVPARVQQIAATVHPAARTLGISFAVLVPRDISQQRAGAT